MQHVFDFCVKFLVSLACIFHTSYETINVVIFCIIWPIITIGLIAWVYVLLIKLRDTRNSLVLAYLRERLDN